MLDSLERSGTFKRLNTGYNSVFKADELSIGLVFPIETYDTGAVPTMRDHIARVQLAEALGFKAAWLRDVPLNVPSFGDAGQCFDPFVYLGVLAAQTTDIALGVSSIILPLRHPAHVAKAAATADVLSGGRLILGVASGDRPEEFPALNVPFETRSQAFRDSYSYIRRMSEQAPEFGNSFGRFSGGIDMLPKPVSGQLPLLITGFSQQSFDWVACNSDGWMTYPRPAFQQRDLISEYREKTATAGYIHKPVMEPFYLDLKANPDAEPRPIHLGLSLGMNALRRYLKSRKEIGVNHVALNLRFNTADIEQTLSTLATEILPEFNA